MQVAVESLNGDGDNNTDILKQSFGHIDKSVVNLGLYHSVKHNEFLFKFSQCRRNLYVNCRLNCYKDAIVEVKWIYNFHKMTHIYYFVTATNEFNFRVPQRVSR